MNIAIDWGTSSSKVVKGSVPKMFSSNIKEDNGKLLLEEIAPGPMYRGIQFFKNSLSRLNPWQDAPQFMPGVKDLFKNPQHDWTQVPDELRGGSVELTWGELVVFSLAYLRRQAEYSEGDNVIFTHPVWGNPAEALFKVFAEQSLLVNVRSSDLAGEVIKTRGESYTPDGKLFFMYEPTASGLAFFNRDSNPLEPVLISIDIGAGTTDFGYMKLPRVSKNFAPGSVLVLSNPKSIHTAGNSLTEALMASQGIQDYNRAEDRKIRGINEHYNSEFFKQWADEICTGFDSYLKEVRSRVDVKQTFTAYLSFSGGSSLIQYYQLNKDADWKNFNLRFEKQIIDVGLANGVKIQMVEGGSDSIAIVKNAQYSVVRGALRSFDVSIRTIDSWPEPYKHLPQTPKAAPAVSRRQCLRCGAELSGGQKSFCSNHCRDEFNSQHGSELYPKGGDKLGEYGTDDWD